LNDAISAALERRFRDSSIGMVETYPGEIFPVDDAACIASLAVHARAAGQPLPSVVAQWSEVVRRRYVDGTTGLLYQIAGTDGVPIDAPRGSGTALALMFREVATRLRRIAARR
jgi:hypothetical protein